MSSKNSLANITDVNVELSIGNNSTSFLVPGSANEMKGLVVHGLTPERAKEIVEQELYLAFPYYDMGIQEFLSLTLIELFGEPYIEDALAISYYFIDNYELEPEEYCLVLKHLLKYHRPEELMAENSLIKSGIEAFKAVDRNNMVPSTNTLEELMSSYLESETNEEEEEEE